MACSFAQINAVAINSSIASKFAVTKPRSVRSALPKPAVSLDAGLRSSLPAKKKKLSAPKLERAGSCTVRAMAEGAATATATDGSWIPVLALEGLPRGERRIVSAGGFTMILFWYKNEIVAVENRSPAEGAYSEGFKNARLTQEGGIRCPVSDSVFDLKTGEVVEWFPNNAVMRAITPKDGVKLNVFPVKVDPEKISVLVSQTVTSMGGDGGALTSIDKNNVFSVESSVYVDDESGLGGSADLAGSAGYVALGLFAIFMIVWLGAGAPTSLPQ